MLTYSVQKIPTNLRMTLHIVLSRSLWGSDVVKLLSNRCLRFPIGDERSHTNNVLDLIRVVLF